MVAGFNVNIASGTAPLTVQFSDTSTGSPSSWNWNFNDGTQNMTVQNGSHTFTQAGTYTVVLTVKNGTQSSTASTQIVVDTYLAAAFESNVTSGDVPLTVQFNDTSAGYPSSWEWGFGDGATNATSRDVSHKFSQAGTYTVVLTVKNGTQSSTASAQVKVTTSLTASFTTSVTSGVLPLTVQFNDTSAGYPSSWEWSFDDGAENITEQNVAYNFVDAGTYHVKLTVTNGTRSSTASATITVSSREPSPLPSPYPSPSPSPVSWPSSMPPPPIQAPSTATPAPKPNGGFPLWPIPVAIVIIIVIVAAALHFMRRH